MPASPVDIPNIWRCFLELFGPDFGVNLAHAFADRLFEFWPFLASFGGPDPLFYSFQILHFCQLCSFFGQYSLLFVAFCLLLAVRRFFDDYSRILGYFRC